jgi:hypothetical protein
MDRTYHAFPLSDETLVQQLIKLNTECGAPNPLIILRLDDQGGDAIETEPDKVYTLER